jgi:hypothetical protein
MLLVRHFLGRRLPRRRWRRRRLHLVRQRHGRLCLRRRLLVQEEPTTIIGRPCLVRHDRHCRAGAAPRHGLSVGSSLPRHHALIPGVLRRGGHLLRLRHLLLVVVLQLHHLLLPEVHAGVLSGGRVMVLRWQGDEGPEGGGADVPGELLACRGDLLADLVDLALEDGDVRNAAVDGVAEARLGLVRERGDGVPALVRREVAEDLGHVAGAEHPVHVRKLGRAVGREVGREDAPLRALAPQQLARRARRARRRHGSFRSDQGWLPSQDAS